MGGITVAIMYGTGVIKNEKISFRRQRLCVPDGVKCHVMEDQHFELIPKKVGNSGKFGTLEELQNASRPKFHP